MDKYICGLNDKIVNIYIPRDGKFEVIEWSINFEFISDTVDDIDSFITVIAKEDCSDDIYALFEYNDEMYIGYYSLMEGSLDRCILADYINMDKEQFSLIKMTITDDNGQQVLKTVFDNIIENM